MFRTYLKRGAYVDYHVIDCDDHVLFEINSEDIGVFPFEYLYEHCVEGIETKFDIVLHDRYKNELKEVLDSIWRQRNDNIQHTLP